MESDEQAITILSNLAIKQEKKSGRVYVSPVEPILRELYSHRRVTAHEGSLWIAPEQAAGPQEFKFALGGTPVVPFATQVLTFLVSIQGELRPDLSRGFGV